MIKTVTYKYKAFISYKHSEIGRKHAIALERGLKQYAKPLLSQPIKIFRDEKHMVPGNDLGKLITNGLEQSEYLIFIAEKDSASSTWCQDELEYWCGKLGKKGKMIIVHVDDFIHLDIENKKVSWEKTNALPSLLSQYISSIPFYVDLHWAKKSEDLSLEHLHYKSIINLISAKLRSVAPEELNDEELRVHQRNRRLRNWAIGLLSISLLISIFTSLFAFRKQKEAKNSAELAVASALEARDSAIVAQEQREIAFLQQKIAENARDSITIAQSETLNALKREERERLKAEKKTRASTNSTIALQKVHSDPTLALRIAEYNLKNHPSESIAVESFHSIVSNQELAFYSHVLKGHTKEITSIAISPNSKLIASGSSDGKVIIWNLQGQVKSIIDNLSNRGIEALEFSPDGSKLYVGTNPITIWNLNGQPVDTLGTRHRNGYLTKDISFSSDGEMVLTGNQDNTATLWNKNGTLIQQFKGAKKSIKKVYFSQYEKNIITCHYNEGIYSWNIENGEMIDTIPIRDVSDFIQIGRYQDEFISSYNLSIELLPKHLSTRRFIDFKEKSYPSVNEGIKSLAYSPEKNYYFTGSFKGNGVARHQYDGELHKLFYGHSDGISCAEFSPNGQFLVTGSQDNTIRIWNVNGLSRGHFTGSYFVNSAAFSSDGKRVIIYWSAISFSKESERTITINDLNGNKVYEYKLTQEFDAFDFSEDEKYLFVGGIDSSIIIIDKESKREVKRLKGHKSNITSLDLSPNQKNIISAGRNGTIIVWDTSGVVIDTFEHKGFISSVQFSPDGRHFLSVSDSLILWEIGKGKRLTLGDNVNKIPKAAFSPNGKKILWGSNNGTINLIKLNGNSIFSLKGHEARISDLCFSPDGQYFLSSGGDDNSVKIWDLNGNNLQTHQLDLIPVSGACFSPDGERVVFGTNPYMAEMFYTPSNFVKKEVASFSLQELFKSGVQLEPKDLLKIKSKTEK